MNRARNLFSEFLIFVIKLAISCKFAAVFFFLLLFSHIFTFGLYRYDFLFLSMLVVQAAFVLTKIETLNELKVISFFHVIGLLFELFKTQPTIASWSYPEASLFRISTVPLYSGFMYSAVASFVIQSWKILQIKLKNYPSPWITVPLAALIYTHFFLKYLGLDLRLILIILVFATYFKTQVSFITTKRRKISLAIGFLLVGLCLWIAENISTFFGAWKYPDQAGKWTLVHNTKIGAWFLLYVVSFIIVSQLILFRTKRDSTHSKTNKLSPRMI